MIGGAVMALIKCPVCGRDVSDKAVSCPNCGCPASEFNKNISVPREKSRVDLIVEEVNRIHRIYPTEKVKAIKELRTYTGWGLKDAKSVIDKAYAGQDIYDTVRICAASVKPSNSNKDCTSNNSSSSKDSTLDKFLAWCDDYSEKSRTPRCPKCHSTSISYDTKKLSFGRALVGDALAGSTGAILGGLSSKKGYAVCLNCGKRWKI